MDLVDDLKGVVAEVSGEPETLAKFSQDASIFEVQPSAVAFPKDSSEIKKLVKFVSQKEGLSLTPRSGGTDMTGGPLTSSIVVSMTEHFNKIFSVESGFAVTQPGVYYHDFDSATIKTGQFLPS